MNMDMGVNRRFSPQQQHSSAINKYHARSTLDGSGSGSGPDSNLDQSGMLLRESSSELIDKLAQIDLMSANWGADGGGGNKSEDLYDAGVPLMSSRQSRQRDSGGAEHMSHLSPLSLNRKQMPLSPMGQQRRGGGGPVSPSLLSHYDSQRESVGSRASRSRGASFNFDSLYEDQALTPTGDVAKRPSSKLRRSAGYVAETRFFDTDYVDDAACFEAVETEDNDEMYLACPDRIRHLPVSEHSPKAGKGKGGGGGGSVSMGLMGSVLPLRASSGAEAAVSAAGAAAVGKKPRMMRSFDTK